MAHQAEGRVVAVVFLSSLVATAGLGLVGNAQQSSDPFAIDATRTHRVAPARTATGERQGASPAGIPISGTAPAPDHRPAVLFAAPAGEPPPSRPAAADDFLIDAVDSAPLMLPAAVDGQATGIVLVQHLADDAPAALVVPLPEAGPATEPMSLRADQRGPDADSIDWPEGATGMIPPLDSGSGPRRGAVANWIRDSLEDLKASRGGVVPFPQRQANASGGGRLFDRIRSGERLLSRERADRQGLRGTPARDQDAAAGGWPTPSPLLHQLDQLAAADRGPGAVWATEAAAALRGVMATAGPHDPAAADGLAAILEHAARRGVVVALEPEPGMVIDTLARAAALFDQLGRPSALRLTVDTGHLECLGEWPFAARLEPWRGLIANVHVDDMRACRHEHLPLGSGDVDLAAAVAALAAAGYRGGLHVELPRQAHRWLETARQSATVLTALIPQESIA